MDVPGAAGSLSIEVGTNHGAIVVGDHNVVTIQVAAASRRVLRSPSPVHRPRAPEGFLDRRDETAALLEALGRREVVRVEGPPGIGRSWFLRQAGAQAAARFADGALQLPPGLRGPGDVLQSIFQIFYDAEPPALPTSTQLRELLAERQALVVIDDASLTTKDTEAVLDAARGCRLIVAGEQGAALADAAAVRLGGLPLDDAMALAERVHGAALVGEARATMLARCREAAGHPRRVIDAAQSLPAVSAVPALGPAERTLLEVVRAFAPQPLPRHSLRELTGLDDAEPALTVLAARGVLQADADDVRLGPAAGAADVPGPVSTEAMVRLGEAARAQPSRRLRAMRALPLLWFAMRKALSAQDHGAVLAIARAWHVPVTLAGCWDSWQQLLAYSVDAARALGDVGAQAWALHQAGTRALALGQASEAGQRFREALVLERQVGDAGLEAATLYHIDLMQRLGLLAAGGGLGAWLAGGLAGKVAAGGVLAGIAAFGWMASAPSLDWSPRRLEFDAVAPGETAVPAQLVVRNTGWRALPPPALAIEGEGAARFAVEGSGCAGRALARGESCTVTVRYAPSDAAASATLALRSARQNAIIPLVGRMVVANALPLPAPSASAGPPLRAEPAVVDFGPQPLSQPGPPMTVRWTNHGAVPMTLGDPRVDPASAPFRADPGSCRAARLEPGGHCDWQLSFVPRAGQGGAHRATVGAEVVGAEPVAVAVSGTGAVARPLFDPPVLDFGARDWPAAAGGPPTTRTVTLANRGDAPMRVALRLGGAQSADFAVRDNCRGELDAGALCTIRVDYLPRSVGPSAAVLGLGGAPAGGSKALPLSGRAVAAVAAVPTPLRPATSMVCASSVAEVEFEWKPPPGLAPGAVAYVLELEPGGAVSVGTETHHRLQLPCPQRGRWRVEARGEYLKTGVSPWRTLDLYRSGSGSAPGPAAGNGGGAVSPGVGTPGTPGSPTGPG